MSLFDNGEPEYFLLLVCNFNTAIAALGTLEADVKFKYLCTLVLGEALSQFESFSSDVESMKPLNVEDIIKGLTQYSFPVNSLPKQSAMRHGMKTTQSNYKALCGASNWYQ